MLMPPFLVLEPVQVVHHLSKGRSMFGLVRAKPSMRSSNSAMHEAAFELLNKYEVTAPIVPVYQTASMALHGVLVTAKLCEPTCMTEMNGICEQWYDATVGPPCRPAAALTIGMMATWLSTIVAVLVILVKSLLGSKAKRA